jgi:hypothetical protein
VVEIDEWQGYDRRLRLEIKSGKKEMKEMVTRHNIILEKLFCYWAGKPSTNVFSDKNYNTIR